MGDPDFVSYITLGAVIISSVVNISSLVGRREAKAASDARVEVKLDNIYTKVDSIEKKQENIEAILNAHGERIKAVEESAKSAHHRIDGLERKNKEEK